MVTKFQEKVYNAVRRIPRGKVSTYAVIARVVGNSWAAQAVGDALNKNPHRNVPCHRVIHSDGTVGGYAHGTKNKIKILRRGGVIVNKNGKIEEKFICRYI